MIEGFGYLAQMFARLDAIMEEYAPLLEEEKQRRKPSSVVEMTLRENQYGWAMRILTTDETQISISSYMNSKDTKYHYITGSQMFFDIAHDKPFGHDESTDDDQFVMLTTQELRDLHKLLGMYLDRLEMFEKGYD